jgi:hypothetical protein
MFEYKKDLLIVDELIYDPSLSTSVVVRINDAYYMYNAAEARNKPVKNLRPYKKQPYKSWRRGSFDHEFLMCGLIPRDGFKVPIGRAITAEELREVIEKYGLTDAEVSEEFENVIGGIYGEEYAKTIKSIQVKVSENEAIPLETALKEMGIQAGSGSPGRVNIRTGWGGSREGAGRPSTGRQKKNYYVTEDEDTKIRELLESLRKDDK